MRRRDADHRRGARPRGRALPRHLVAAAAASALVLGGVVCAQDQSAPPASGGGSGQTTSPAASGRTVSIDPSGGPTNLADKVKAAIQAWQKAAPTLVDLSIAPSATSTITYAPPALLGPDTFSLDLRTPGKASLTVEVTPGAIATHPMVLLHEVGVLLGLPEGNGDVMAYAVPASGEPDAPSSADVKDLQAQRTYAPEDLNHDGTVDFYDLVLFGQAFGSQGVNLPADFNRDGRVDRQDLALLEKAYTFSPPSRTAPSASANPPPSSEAPGGGTSGDSGGTGSSGTGSSGTGGGTSGTPQAPGGDSTAPPGGSSGGG